MFRAYFVCYIRVPGTAGLQILFSCEPDKAGEIMLLFNFFCQTRIWKVPCDPFILHEMTTHKKKEDPIGLIARLPIGDRKRLSFVRFLF